MRRTIALVVSAFMVVLLASACSDDTGTKKVDQKITKREASVDLSVADLPATDLPKVDLPVKKDTGPKVDVSKVDVSKTDGPKVDVSKVDQKKGDISKVDQKIPTAPNAKCASPTTVTLAGSPAKVVVTGDTSGSVDEFPTVDCGSTSGPWKGAQLYYKVNLPTGKKYKVTLTSSSDLALYAFPAATACNVTAINAACKDPTPADPNNVYSSDDYGDEHVRIAPTATADWMIVVDSWYTNTVGTFTLTIEEIIPVTNGTCAAPKTLTLSGTPAKVVETSDTTSAVDQFATVDCSSDLYWPMNGPQVYYKVNLTAGKKYKAQLVPSSSFDGALYAFPAATACTATAIDAACKNPTGSTDNIYNSDDGGDGDLETIRIAPTTTADWIIVVDSSDTTYYGSFTLTITEIAAPANGVCASATALSFTAGKATVSGDSGDAANQFTNTILCGGSSALQGPQVYYRMNIASGKGMKITLKPTFSAYVYLFPTSANCAAAAIETACASGGTTGALYGSVSSGSSTTFAFAPTTAGDYVLAVDSTSTTGGGPFDLTVEEFTPPTNAKCATPATVTLTTSPVTVTGDTTGAPNQFGTTIGCGTGYDYDGSQLYYKMTLLAGKTYTLVLTPSATWDPAFYAFTDATCTAATINTQCSASSMHSDTGYTGDKETLTITPTTTADYIFAVDTYSATASGTFSLNISWL
jgi:hypothetical protein